MILFRILYTQVFLLLFSMQAIALDKAPMAVSGTAYIGQVLLGLLAVLTLIVGMGWLLKRFSQGGFLGQQVMSVVATMPLGTRERLIVVDLKGKQILLGISPGRITNLHTFDEPLITQSSTPNESDFSSKLRDIMQRSVAGKSPVNFSKQSDQADKTLSTTSIKVESNDV